MTRVSPSDRARMTTLFCDLVARDRPVAVAIINVLEHVRPTSGVALIEAVVARIGGAA